jgi:hypothetical protein
MMKEALVSVRKRFLFILFTLQIIFVYLKHGRMNAVQECTEPAKSSRWRQNHSMKHRVLILIVVSYLLHAHATEQLPLNVGNTWVYKDSATDIFDFGISQSIITITLIKKYPYSNDTICHIFTVHDSGFTYKNTVTVPYDYLQIDTVLENNGQFIIRPKIKNMAIYNDLDNSIQNTESYKTQVVYKTINDTLFKAQKWDIKNATGFNHTGYFLSNQYFGCIFKKEYAYIGAISSDYATTLIKFNNMPVTIPPDVPAQAKAAPKNNFSSVRAKKYKLTIINKRSRPDEYGHLLQLNGRMGSPNTYGVSVFSPDRR